MRMIYPVRRNLPKLSKGPPVMLPKLLADPMMSLRLNRRNLLRRSIPLILRKRNPLGLPLPPCGLLHLRLLHKSATSKPLCLLLGSLVVEEKPLFALEMSMVMPLQSKSSAIPAARRTGVVRLVNLLN